MPRLIWSEASQRDIVKIDRFLDEHNPRAAARIARAIRATAIRLVEYPRIGRPFDGQLRILGVRRTPYLVFYRVREEVVEIARIRHFSEDWAGLSLLDRPEIEP
ncbi:type II toxin-antitoxin system RelE/ParE family toxin [Sphingomonas sp. PB4P5]|uniref:type II toxin-antitoxin system RelE/ParE family toxin n=1 Tax=Parasphingomonas puruogangriensis TaxID=3096155 RepID=UPI002FC87365